MYALKVVHDGAQRESELAHAQFLASTATAASNDALWALNEGRIESTIDRRIASDSYSWTVKWTGRNRVTVYNEPLAEELAA